MTNFSENNGVTTEEASSQSQSQPRLGYRPKGNRNGSSQRMSQQKNRNNNENSYYSNRQKNINEYNSYNMTNTKDGGNNLYKNNRRHRDLNHQNHRNSHASHQAVYEQIGAPDIVYSHHSLDTQPHHTIYRKLSNDSGVMISDSNNGTQSQSSSLGASPPSVSESNILPPHEYRVQQYQVGPQCDSTEGGCSCESNIHQRNSMPIFQDTHGLEERYSVHHMMKPIFPPEMTHSLPSGQLPPWGYKLHLPNTQIMPMNDQSPLSTPEIQSEQHNISSSSSPLIGDKEIIKENSDPLREQLEWYFSPRNLATDSYLLSKMNSERWVLISVIAQFKKVKAMTTDIQEVVNALKRSPTVLVDVTETMVKPVTVDRPRTTLILRDLPEDVDTEEIGAVFPERYCPKSIRKESIGNMWFIEFETADDALAMLEYTRGRYLRDTPIAARLKSTTVLTGGEYRETQRTSNPASRFTIWPMSPSNPQDGSTIPGFSIPYRRFPAEDTNDPSMYWSESHMPYVLSHQGPIHHHQSDPPLPPEIFFSPASYDFVTTTRSNMISVDGQLWVPAPVYGMSVYEDSSNYRQGFNHMLMNPTDENSNGGMRNSINYQGYTATTHRNRDKNNRWRNSQRNRKMSNQSSEGGQNQLGSQKGSKEAGHHNNQHRYKTQLDSSGNRYQSERGGNTFSKNSNGQYSPNDSYSQLYEFQSGMIGFTNMYSSAKYKNNKRKNKSQKNRRNNGKEADGQGTSGVNMGNPDQLCNSNNNENETEIDDSIPYQEMQNLTIDESTLIVGPGNTSMIDSNNLAHENPDDDLQREKFSVTKAIKPKVARRNQWKTGYGNRHVNYNKSDHHTLSLEPENFPPLPSASNNYCQSNIVYNTVISTGRANLSWGTGWSKGQSSSQRNQNDVPTDSTNRHQDKTVVNQLKDTSHNQ